MRQALTTALADFQAKKTLFIGNTIIRETNYYAGKITWFPLQQASYSNP